jgi:hypothetical protein
VGVVLVGVVLVGVVVGDPGVVVVLAVDTRCAISTTLADPVAATLSGPTAAVPSVRAVDVRFRTIRTARSYRCR